MENKELEAVTFNNIDYAILDEIGNFIYTVNVNNANDIKIFKTKIEEDSGGINIYIGGENSFDDDMTTIKMKYTLKGEEGTIAFIGPKRMDYSKVISLLEYIDNTLKED